MAKKEIVTYSQQTFENIKHTDENGTEFWYARELQTALEYAQWRRFQESIGRAKTACEASGLDIRDHFADVGKMVDLGSGSQREITDIKLSRYACYLIVMNGDPRKEVIALGQTYFAVKTRQKEISDSAAQLSEDEKRLAIRDEVTIRNKFLASSAKAAGVKTNRSWTTWGPPNLRRTGFASPRLTTNSVVKTSRGRSRQTKPIMLLAKKFARRLPNLAEQCPKISPRPKSVPKS